MLRVYLSRFFCIFANKNNCILEVSFIGAGNLATNLALALDHAGHHVRQVYSRTMGSARALANAVGAEPIVRLSKMESTADIYVFSVTDRVLAELIKELSETVKGKIFVHTAGSVPMTVFASYVNNFGVLYPMQTFSKTHPIGFADIPCFIEASDPATKATIVHLAGTISHRVFEMDSDQRRYLHLAAVFACNFTNHCYSIAAEILSRHQIPFEVMLPLIDRTAQKTHLLSPIDSQTGPAVRFDQNVMDKQRQLLSDPATKEIYDMMSQDIHRYHTLQRERNIGEKSQVESLDDKQ